MKAAVELTLGSMISGCVSRFFRRIGLSVALVALLFSTMPLTAQTNSWTNSVGGKWESLQWSSGVRPNSLQSIVITNNGVKTITVDSATTQNFVSTMTVKDLQVSCPGTGTNTLLLNNAGTNVPLRASNGVTLGARGQLINLSSGLSIDAGGLRLSGGQLLQDGGFVRGGATLFAGGRYHLTNGLFDGAVNIIYGSDFNQYGGKALVPSLQVDGGSYNFHAGELQTDTTRLTGSQGMVTFTQYGGTNHTTSLQVSTSFGGQNSRYNLNGGWLSTGNVMVGPNCGFYQSNGVHVITNTLTIQGAARYYPPQPILAVYDISPGASLSARSLVVDGSQGFSRFFSSGDTKVSGTVQFTGSSDYLGLVGIGGGTFTCSNVLNNGTVFDISQTGGRFIVSNLFSISGFYPGVYSGSGARFVRYNFSGGTLTASNIQLQAEWIIGGSAEIGRISNPGYFRMAGTMRIGDATEQLGRFILASNSCIDFGPGIAKVSFADSHAESWDLSALVNITNWAGSAGDRLSFGNSESGLTVNQLDRIRFINPIGFPAGTYKARILNTGEIVPLVSPIFQQVRGNALVLDWDGNYTLQSATNVVGPFEDVIGASRPYTNQISVAGQRFFRLRP